MVNDLLRKNDHACRIFLFCSHQSCTLEGTKALREGVTVDLDAKILAEWAMLNSRVRMQILKNFVEGLPEELSTKLASVHLELSAGQTKDIHRH